MYSFWSMQRVFEFFFFFFLREGFAPKIYKMMILQGLDKDEKI